MGDNVHKPNHYCYSKYEPKDVIREWGLNFNLGSAVKYIARAGRKDDIIQDLKKAREFLTFEIEALEAKRADKPRYEDTACRCIPPEPKGEELFSINLNEFVETYGEDKLAELFKLLIEDEEVEK